MTKVQRLFLLLVICWAFLLAGAPQTRVKPAIAADSAGQESSSSSPAFAVCQGIFALCTEAVCDPVITKTPDGGKEIEFSCRCKVKVGYSAGANRPRTNPCEAVPTGTPTVGQQISSRYAPIKSYVACNNKRPWAWCLDSTCKVDHVDPNDPKKNSATCKCGVATGAPYVYVPPDGKYSRTGCDKEYISSATPEDVFQVTEFLTTPAGQNLPPSLPTLLVPPTLTPPPTPSPSH